MLLFHTDNLPHHGLERIFDFAAQTGYDGIEIGVGVNYDTHDPEYLKSLEKRYKIPIKAFSMNIKKEEVLIKKYQNTVKEFHEVTMNLHPPQNLSFKYKKWLKEIAPKLAKKYGLRLCYRNVPFESLMGVFPKRSDNTMSTLKSKGFVCTDLTALAKSNEDIMKSIEVLGGHLKHVYLSNVYRNSSYSMPDRGVLPLESYLTKLAKIDYRGHFTLYVKGRDLQEGKDEVTLEKMKQAREFFDKYYVAVREAAENEKK